MKAKQKIVLLTACLTLWGCNSNPDERDLRNAQTPAQLYASAQDSLKAGNFRAAVFKLENLDTRFPFGEFAEQAKLDLIYAHHASGNTEAAIDAADTFIRENPRHKDVDYAYYMKGVVYFEQGKNLLERWFRIDPSDRPPSDASRSYEALNLMLNRYPDSQYAPDAQKRMVHLRNRLATYEYHVAEYYMRRGAYVGAVNRVDYILTNYSGATITPKALEIMVDAYEKLGMNDKATDAQRILEENYPNQG